MTKLITAKTVQHHRFTEEIANKRWAEKFELPAAEYNESRRHRDTTLECSIPYAGRKREGAK